MRLLFFGDLAATGFGSVTSDLGRELLRLGVDVRFVSQNDTGAQLPQPFYSRTANLLSLVAAMDPATGEQGIEKANDLIGDLVRGTTSVTLHDGQTWGAWEPDAVLLLGDYRAAQFMVQRAIEAFQSRPTLLYIPVEGNDLPPAWEALFLVAHPVAMSKFGAKQLAKVVGHDVPMIHHGIDTYTFRPVSTRPVTITIDQRDVRVLRTREDCKRFWAPILATVNQQQRIPRKWLLRTDRHMPRKQYGRMIRALAPVLMRNPAWGLVIHCQVFDQGGYLVDTVSKYPAIRDRILFTNMSLDRETLVSLYNAADLYVSNSAEGFGLTIAEALACGVPAVGVRYSAVPEVIGPAGVTVDRYSLVDNEYDHYWCAVDEAAFAKEVEALMHADARREALGAKGPKHVASSFQWANAARQFVAVIESEVAAWQHSPASQQSASTSITSPIPASSPTA